MILQKVISGGQTGVDQVGLRVGKRLGYETGGLVPFGWRTDDGPAPWLADYGCTEADSSGYRMRTIANVRASQMTVWFGDATSSGGRLTLKTVRLLARLHLINPSAENLRRKLILERVLVLNVAGNRFRTNPEARRQAEIVLTDALAR